MAVLIANLQGDQRALRNLQAPEQVHWDSKTQDWRVSSAAFKPQTDGTVSVDLEEAQRRDGLPLTHGYPRVENAVGLIAHSVERLRSDGFTVSHVPITGNDYHGEARGSPTQGARKRLARECEIIVPLDGDEAQRLQDELEAKKASEVGNA